MKNNKTFLGTGWSFPPTFDKAQAAVVMVSQEEDIRQSLSILFQTEPGERTMLPEYGSNLREMLFDIMDNTRFNYMKSLIQAAILRYEPRIDLNSVGINDAQYLDGVLYIELDYTIRNTNSRANMVFPYYIVEGTNVPDQYKVVQGG